MKPPADTPADTLADLAAKGLLRRLRPLDSRSGATVVRDGCELINFSSNDYLGLAAHPALAAAFMEGVGKFGAGATASRLICGTQPPHRELEEALAAAKESSAALVFGSGFATAIGVLPAVVGKGDFVILDKLCHASLVDGARLSGATIRVYPHHDLDKLGCLLAGIRGRSTSARLLVVTESVFSMDGDVCPLLPTVELCERHGALLLLDEAHATGVLGPAGMGLAEAAGLQQRVTFQMGTFSKALGLAGGYVAASREWVDCLVNRARSFIYSTAPPPALAHAALAALELVRSTEGAELRRRLKANILRFGRLVGVATGSSTAIQPVRLGAAEAALAASARLEQAGLLVPAIRYPTVPRDQARLRVSLSATHSTAQVECLAAAVRTLAAVPAING